MLGSARGFEKGIPEGTTIISGIGMNETPDEVLLRDIEFTFGLSCAKAKDAVDPRDENLAFQIVVSMQTTDLERAAKIEMLANSMAQELRGFGYSKSIDRFEKLLISSTIGCELANGTKIE
jgi:hypothetical protein